MAELEAIEGEEEAPKKKKKIPILLILLILLLPLLGGGAALWFLVPHEVLPFGLGQLLGSGTAQQQQSTYVEAEIPPPDNLITLPTFVVNLSDPQGRRFIRLGLALEVASPSNIIEIRQQEPVLRDTIIMLLSSKTYAEISTSNSKAELKRQITDRINQALGGPKVIQALITDLSIRYQ